MLKNFFWLVATVPTLCTGLEKPLVVMIASYNNQKWYQQNLGSVFDQDYTNYRVIYCDDCSDDHTGDLVQAYIKQRGKENKVTLLKNPERRKALANYYRAIHLCGDLEIIVQLDGDDWFSHNRVLSRINELYQDPNVWLAHSQFKRWPSGKIGDAQETPHSVIQAQSYRQNKFWLWTGLRTFYAGLAKQIKLAHLLFKDGTFFPSCSDGALIFPLLELAANHYAFIPDALYTYNVNTPLNDFRINRTLQEDCGRMLRAQQKYKPAFSVIPQTFYELEPTTQILVTSNDSPKKLANLLKTIEKYHPAITTSVIYLSSDKNLCSYLELKKLSDTTRFVAIDDLQDLQQVASKCIEQSTCNYVLYIPDTYELQKTIDIKRCIKTLEYTYADAFFLNLSHDGAQNEAPSCAFIDDDIYAWQFKCSKNAWADAWIKQTLLLKKSNLPLIFSPQARPNGIGLFFEHVAVSSLSAKEFNA